MHPVGIYARRVRSRRKKKSSLERVGAAGRSYLVMHLANLSNLEASIIGLVLRSTSFQVGSSQPQWRPGIEQVPSKRKRGE